MRDITIGEMTAPNNTPNLNHSLFGTDNKVGAKYARKKKKREMIMDQMKILLPCVKGYREISMKTIKNTIPKLRSDPFFIFIYCLYSDKTNIHL